VVAGKAVRGCPERESTEWQALLQNRGTRTNTPARRPPTHLQCAGARRLHALVHKLVQAEQHKERLVAVEQAAVARSAVGGRRAGRRLGRAARHQRHQRAAAQERALVLVLLGKQRGLQGGGGGRLSNPGGTQEASRGKLAGCRVPQAAGSRLRRRQAEAGQGRTSCDVTPSSSSSSVLSASVAVSWSLAWWWWGLGGGVGQG
jgi:hypothetical protein